jgi:hypothetical protein
VCVCVCVCVSGEGDTFVYETRSVRILEDTFYETSFHVLRANGGYKCFSCE